MEDKRELKSEELEQVAGGELLQGVELGTYEYTIPAGESAKGVIDTCYRKFQCYDNCKFVRALARLDSADMILFNRKMTVVAEKVSVPEGNGIPAHSFYNIRNVLASRDC